MNYKKPRFCIFEEENRSQVRIRNRIESSLSPCHNIHTNDKLCIKLRLFTITMFTIDSDVGVLIESKQTQY